MNQKKGILGLGQTKPCLCWSHLLAYLGLFLFLSFLFSTFSPPFFVAIDQPWQTQRLPWSFSFLFLTFSRPLFICNRPALANSTAWLFRTFIALVGSSSYKKFFAFLNWATHRTKKLDGESFPLLVGSLSVLFFLLSCVKQLVGKKNLWRRIL